MIYFYKVISLCYFYILLYYLITNIFTLQINFSLIVPLNNTSFFGIKSILFIYSYWLETLKSILSNNTSLLDTSSSVFLLI